MNAVRILLVAALSLWFAPTLGATAAGNNSRTTPADQGMVIRGDQEAPLVLYIVPWQEPKAMELPAPLIPLLPQVFDHERSLIDDPVHRSLDLNRSKNE
jgi:hypothetical protein